MNYKHCNLYTDQRSIPSTYYSDSLANQSAACGGRVVKRLKTEDDHNGGVETITTSKATCEKKKYQKKHAKEVSNQARDIEKIHTWHDGTVALSLRAWQTSRAT